MSNKNRIDGNLAQKKDLSGRDLWSSPGCQSASQNDFYNENSFDGKKAAKIFLDDLPTDRKYTIGIEEAARYYGIGTKKLRQLVADNPQENFYLEIGSHVLLKRKQFEAWLDTATAL